MAWREFLKSKGVWIGLAFATLFLDLFPANLHAAEKVFLTASFTPITFKGKAYESGGAKASYVPNKFMILSARYLMETQNPCWKMDCRSYSNNTSTLHGQNEASLLIGAIHKLDRGHLAAQIGLGGGQGQNIVMDSIGAESRDRYTVLSIPIDFEAIFYSGKYFGFGMTGYGSVNRKNSLIGIMGSLQIRFL